MPASTRLGAATSRENHLESIRSGSSSIAIKTEDDDMVADSFASATIVKTEDDELAIDNTPTGAYIKTESNAMQVDKASPSPSSSVVSNAPLDKESKLYNEVLLCRVILQRWVREKLSRGIKLTDDENTKLCQIIHYCSRLGENAKPFLEEKKVAKAFKAVLKHSQLLTDGIPPQIGMLLEAWRAGHYNLVPPDDPAISDDSSEIESDAALDDDVSDLESIDSSTDAMRGIIVTRGRSGQKVYSLDKAYQRPANVFGHNGLKVGDWWPMQICALRDGAHGSLMGGIAGKASLGAYSVIISGGDRYEDQDFGHTVWYTGSGKPGEDQSLTIGNQALINSSRTKDPIRVLRTSRAASAFAPSSGLRYDGLYEVAGYDHVPGSDGHRVYKFKLVRQNNQEDIKLNIPAPADMRKLRRSARSSSP